MAIYAFPTHADIGGSGLGSTVAEPMWQTMNRLFCGEPGDGFVWGNGFACLSFGGGKLFNLAPGIAFCGGYVFYNSATVNLANLLTGGNLYTLRKNYIWLGVTAVDTGHGYRATGARFYVTLTTAPPPVTFYLRLYKATLLGTSVYTVTSYRPTLNSHITVPSF